MQDGGGYKEGKGATYDANEDDDDEPNGGGGYRTFRSRQASAVLYRISPIDASVNERMEAYVHGGVMDADLRFAREVYGLVNTSGRKDFELFWESPWVEEHVQDTVRKRKLDAQQRAVAVRSYIRASSTTTAAEPEKIDRFLDNVDRLTEWEDRHGAQDMVKTVSRMLQSFERASISNLLALLSTPVCRTYAPLVRSLVDPAFITQHASSADVTSVACTLRRSSDTFHLFAAAVASEIIWAEATSGARNTTIFLCKQLDERRRESGMALIRGLYALRTDLPHDTVGLPLMQVKASMCVCRGILVVMPGSTSATYILDLIDGTTASDLSQVKNIKISRVMEEPVARELFDSRKKAKAAAQ